MSMQDPLSDMLTRIRNGLSARFPEVEMPASKLKVAVANTLEEEGYIAGYEVAKQGDRDTLKVTLKYFQGKPVISVLKRVSKPSLRIYRGHTDLPVVLGGLGVAIISTSKGVMSNRMAKKAGLGGEVLCVVE